MVSKVVKVVNEQGLHMRPAGLFAKAMKEFDGCTVILESGGKKAKATTIMQLMAAGIKCGAEVEIKCDGENEDAALARAVEMFESGFGE